MNNINNSTIVKISRNIKHTIASQNITFHTTPSGGSATEILRITHDGKLAKLSGNLELDIAGELNIDVDGGAINYKDGGTHFGSIEKDGNNFRLESKISDGDIVFRGSDAGSGINALTLDMSAAGKATFNSDVVSTGIDLNENTSMYATDASLSYYSSSNGVYLNGPGTNGWLRLNASGVSNARTHIDLYGQNQGDYIKMRAGNTDTLYINLSLIHI